MSATIQNGARIELRELYDTHTSELLMLDIQKLATAVAQPEGEQLLQIDSKL